MRTVRRLLLLAGSAEARQIARDGEALGWEVEAWVSETPRGPSQMPVPTRLREFNDVDMLARDMGAYDAVIDASHGFDGRMTEIGFQAAEKAGLPFLSFARPCWPLERDWQAAPTVTAAIGLIAQDARVFSATGWASLPEYAAFRGACLMMRQTTAHARAVPYPFVQLVFGDPPFTVASEMALFADLKADTLICRNLGGTPSRPKLEAALALDMPVILIDRPTRPVDVETVGTISDVLVWLAAR